MSDFVNEQNAKRGNYAQVISDIAAEKICPFCPEHIHRIHPNPIVEKTHWLVTDNAYPYKGTKQHLLFVHKVHVEDIHDLAPEAWGELGALIKEVTRERDMVGGTLVMRFGKTGQTGASVSHLHAQLTQGNPESPDYDPKTGVICRVG